MYSSVVPLTALPLPFLLSTVQAGFPSPADDFATKRHDLNELMIEHPLATYVWRVAGKSMVDAGIDDGDLLVVDRALTAKNGDIVIAQVDADFTVKYLRRRGDRVALVPANATFPEIRFSDAQSLIICGVATFAIKPLRPNAKLRRS